MGRKQDKEQKPQPTKQMLKPKIVSANYRDRKSPYRWLIRQEDQPVESARAFKSVKARGVKIISSNAIEEGFGCRIVAKCQAADGFDPEPDAPVVKTLRFDHDAFKDDRGRRVDEMLELDLGEDGSIKATVTP